MVNARSRGNARERNRPGKRRETFSFAGRPDLASPRRTSCAVMGMISRSFDSRALAILIVCAAALSGCQRSTKESAAASPATPGAAPAPASPAQAPADSSAASTTTPPDQLASDDAIAAMLAPWKGDLDGMVERRYIRVLVTFSKTNYFLDGPDQHGATHDGAKLFEEFLNKRLQSKHIHVQIAFIPVSRDRLLPSLAEGRGDIAAANLTVTPARQQVADFSQPIVSDVRELVVTRRANPRCAPLRTCLGARFMSGVRAATGRVSPL
jgi:ABC-type amino acid transport substrate-binding protein